MEKWCSKQVDLKAEQSDSVPEGKCYCCGEDISSNHAVGFLNLFILLLILFTYLNLTSMNGEC